MPKYLVRLVQWHEAFRKAELHALASMAGVIIEFLSYDEDVGVLFSNASFFALDI